MRIYYYASPHDHDTLLEFVQSLGLFVISTEFQTGEAVLNQDFSLVPGCYLSHLPANKLNVTIEDNGYLNPSRNPVILWRRSYVSDNWIVAGEFYIEKRSEDISRIIGIDVLDERKIVSSFNKIRKWIVGHWDDLGRGHFYYAPEAQALKSKGFQCASYIPSTVPLTEVITVE